ncbi:MAG: hypothetical protein AAGA60_20130 [Cyanobacteria bacterium P01_E01_bin.42]
MNTHNREHYADHPYMLGICVILVSLIVGLIPITINNHLGSRNPDSAPVVLGEAGLWKILKR